MDVCKDMVFGRPVLVEFVEVDVKLKIIVEPDEGFCVFNWVRE